MIVLETRQNKFGRKSNYIISLDTGFAAILTNVLRRSLFALSAVHSTSPPPLEFARPLMVEMSELENVTDASLVIPLSHSYKIDRCAAL